MRKTVPTTALDMDIVDRLLEELGGVAPDASRG